jgi:hypothetical protein
MIWQFSPKMGNGHPLWTIQRDNRDVIRNGIQDRGLGAVSLSQSDIVMSNSHDPALCL